MTDEQKAMTAGELRYQIAMRVLDFSRTAMSRFEVFEVTDSILSLMREAVEGAKLTNCDYSHPKDLYFNIKQVFPEWEVFSIFEQDRIRKVCEAQLDAVLKLMGGK
jgi:hypothetical protein